MGVWGTGVFDNDDALDWVYDLADAGKLAQVSSALDVVVRDSNNHPEISDCRIGLAAAEIIAAMHGDPSPELPEEAEEWIGDEILENDSLRAKAENAVKVILSDSELKDKWEKSANYDLWKATIRDLLKRLEI